MQVPAPPLPLRSSLTYLGRRSGPRLGVDKWVGAISSPGWFDSMQGLTESSQTNLKLGQSEAKGSLFWRNSDGAVIGSYAVKAAFTMDQKTNTPKGTIEGTWEIGDGIDHFANVRGHGTVKGELNGASEIDHWSGTITGFENRLSDTTP